MTNPIRRLSVALCALTTWICSQSTAHAHPVTVDGAATEWLNREANADNLGIIARGAGGEGSYVWRDRAADTRTDLASPETIADLTRLRVTSSAAGLSFFVTLNNASAHTGANPVQLQIAIDTNQLNGSGQNNFAGFADTVTAEGARWERLIQTQFTAGSTARVFDTAFTVVDPSVAVGVATAGGVTNLEMTVPWAALGLTAPPATPLRFTVATFREQAGGNTVDLGGGGISNAIDVISDYGTPRTSSTLNTFNEVSDQRVDYSFDVYFNGTSGDVYAPLLITRYVSNATDDAAGGGEWFAMRNMTPGPISLAGYRFTEEEVLDGTESSVSFPTTATLAAGATFIAAQDAVSYFGRFGSKPDAEWTSNDATVPDMPQYLGWSSGPVGNLILAASDELILLDPSHTAVDIIVYGGGAYAGVTAMTAPPANNAASRNQTTFGDTDNCTTDFTIATGLCANDAACGACGACTLNLCGVRAPGFTCRASAGDCDVPETCDGTSLACPADGFAANTTVCRSATGGVCDVAETCTGSSAACPADGFAVAGTTCRAAASACDMAEACTGTSAVCPMDQVSPMMTVCRPSGGACDVAETCDGLSNVCPMDMKASGATTCRSSAGACDAAEVCDGMNNACPTDSVEPATTVCRASTGTCDAAETCDGSTTACPVDGFAANTVVCRASAGACDSAETCTGSSAACPMDTVAPATTVCRASAGACDTAESCDGSTTACPADGFQPATVTCRASAGDCDTAESCTGSSAACPVDGFAANTVVCRASAGACDSAETCTGSAAACPADTVAPATTVCRASAGVCDTAETCDGTTGVCPADTFAPNTTVCRASAGACDIAESCSGSAAACPADFVASNTTVCRASAGACDNAETCDGVATACPVDGFVSAGTSCADMNRCNGDETCNATGVCQPGTPVVCAPSMNACQVNACNNTTGSCELSNAMAGTTCSDGVFCNGEESCNGMGACVMGAPPEDAGAVCSDAGDAAADASDDAAAPDAGEDAASEAGDDAAADAAAADAGEDAGEDAASEAGEDAGEDVLVADASEDASEAMDASADAASEAGADARIDARADVRTDARADAATMSDASGDGPGSENDGLSGSGCGCRTTPTGPTQGAPVALALLAAAIVVTRARRRRAA
jgi:MYXO-CTERM domain-containing protein